MTPLAQDLHYAFRTLRKSPLFTAVAGLSLALGIGANTAIFTLVNQIILELLPVKHPEELVLLSARGQHYGSNNGANAISYPMYQDFREKNQVFSAMFCRYQTSLNLSFDGRTERIAGELVSGNYFPVLGVGAALGRVFTASDDLMQGGHPVAVLSYGYWQSRFASDPGVIGKRILVSGYPFTIVGVSRQGFDGVEPGYAPQIRIPMMMRDVLIPGSSFDLNNRRGRFVQVFGRLKPGMTVDSAKAGLRPLFHQIIEMEVQQKEFARASAYTKEQFLKMWIDVLPASKGWSELRNQFSEPLLALTAIVAMVLLISCLNVANLLIARAAARQKEIAVRLALGAGRWRLIAQLLQESLLLSLMGGVAGIALAIWMDRALIGFLPKGVLPTTISSAPDGRILGFTLAISLLTGIFFGLAPALQATRPELAPTLKDQAGSVAAGPSVALRKTLVVAQVALSLLLLIGSGLFIRSLTNLKDVNPGFHTENLIALGVDPTMNGYKPERSFQFYRQLSQRMSELPGVKAASLAVMSLLDGHEWDSSVTVEGYTAKVGEGVQPHMQFVTPGFFATLKIRLPLGRDFTDRDQKASPLVAIVNERFAKRYFGESNPIGRRVGMGGNPGTKTDIEIVGVAQDTRYEDLRTEIPYEMYRPYQQMDLPTNMTAYIRSEADPENLFSAMRRAVHEIDSNVPVYRMRTMTEQVDGSLMSERLLAALSTAFGLLATLLAAIGLYGVMAYMVTQRTREIGIRVALGAKSGNIAGLVMREVMLLAAAGIGIGLPAAAALTRLAKALFYGVTPNDPLTVVLAAVSVAATAFAAGYLPSRRAARVDPMRALRWE